MWSFLNGCGFFVIDRFWRMITLRLDTMLQRVCMRILMVAGIIDPAKVGL
jgi:hypothetical protein